MSGQTSGFKSLFSRWWCLQPTNIKGELHTSSSLSPHTHICLFLDNLSSCLSCFCQALEESIPWLSFCSLSPFCLLTLPGGRSHPVRELHIWLQRISDQISRSVVSDSLRPHESQHARPPCPSLTPGVHSDSCPSSQ